MIPLTFDYEVAESVDHAIELLGQYGDEAKLLAGGHSLLQEQCGLLAYTASLVGDPQVRHRGTIGGSISHGDAASDLPSALLALDGTFVIRGPGGERTVAAADFFKDYLETDLAPDEVLTEIRVSKLGSNAGWSYKKFNRRAQDWAVVGVAAVVERSNGSIGSAPLGVTNLGSTPLRGTAAEHALP